VSSPPVALFRVCANGPGRLRHVRARTISAGFLVLAASISFLASAQPLHAQFPIRQVPQGSGFRAQGSGVREQGPGTRSQASSQFPVPGAASPAPGAAPPFPAVARVVVPEKDGISYGSGTLVDARGQFGLVVSNWHVVRDAAGQITVEFPDGFKSPAEVVKTDKDWDLAALSIYRPRAVPVPVSAAAPQPGEPLTIAGYGGGDWRIASGRCTQYLAPGVEFPHEMVELAAEARQGDSGGPILNQRGELAGVLFGSGPGYTSGSYGGRVLKFLATVVPGGAPGGDGLPANSLPGDRGLASADASRAGAAPPASSPPQVTALHENHPSAAAPYSLAISPPPPDVTALTPALKPTINPLLSPPPRREAEDRFGPGANRTAADDVDPRVAVSPTRIDFSSPPLVTAALPLADASPAPRISTSTPMTDLNQAPANQLLAAIWKQVGGPTLFDQTKTVLAMIGILSLIVVFLRFGSQKEREHEEE
jgi:serine protease Do